MLEAIVEGLAVLLQPAHLFMLMVGMLIGIVVGILPGVSTMFAYAVIFPFILQLDPAEGIPILIGITATTSTGDSISSILLGIPGGASTAALVVDGHAMSRKGEAGRALSAAFTVAAVGGVIGAIFLAASVPVAQFLLEQFLSPEFFMLCILGLAMTASLTGKRATKGIVAASLGLLLGGIGTAAAIPYLRYTFEVIYLFDGVPMILLALGLFAIPEIVDMMVTGSSISQVFSVGKGWLTGLRDAVSEKWLLLRSSMIGIWFGFLPGLGASAAAWTAYAHAVQSAKDKTRFGHGDVRGVMAPECANGACKGGDLILTLSFGIPGSSIMALFIMALTIYGIHPGPEMITQNLSTVFLVIWSLAIASIIGAIICFGLIKPLSRVAAVPGHVLAPFILLFVLVGAYSNNQNWGDLIALVAIGLLGILMKQFDFSRPALLIGFVLGPLLERNLWLTVQRFGAVGWLARPWVIVFLVFLAASMVVAVRWQKQQSLNQEKALRTVPDRSRAFHLHPSTLFAGALTVIIGVMLLISTGFVVPVGLYIWIAGIPGFIFCVVVLVGDVRSSLAGRLPAGQSTEMEIGDGGLSPSAVRKRFAMVGLWFAAMYAAIWLVGFKVGLTGFFLAYLAVEARSRWYVAVILAACAALFLVYFDTIANAYWPEGVLKTWIPWIPW